jgi:hypothetical protein
MGFLLRVLRISTCPMLTPGVPPIPHVGGPILGPGADRACAMPQAQAYEHVHVCRSARRDRQGSHACWPWAPGGAHARQHGAWRHDLDGRLTVLIGG